MQTYRLVPHPGHPPHSVTDVHARIIGIDRDWARFRWRIEGSQKLVIPAFAGRGRADGLWKTTCFEVFLMPGGSGSYCEFNLSPSERWNAYDFNSYRDGMRERVVEGEPGCTMRRGSHFAIFDAALPISALPPGDCAMALSAVIEEEGPTKSYWALAHPEDEPDFHSPACFTGMLAAREPA